MAGAADLQAAGIWPDPGELREAVIARARAALEGLGLTLLPLSPASGMSDHRGTHAAHLDEILANLQSVARADPEAVQW
jgi:1,2-phenylacetyl-CoA epoxidase catalytic subunit